MVLKAVLFSFSGIVIKDDEIRQTISDQILLAENLRPNRDDYYEACSGRSDRACLKALLAQRGRAVTDETLDKLLAKESVAYQSWLENLADLPIYPGLEDLIFRCRTARLKMAIVTGAERSQVTSVLKSANLIEHFPTVIAGDNISASGSKPAPDGYQKVVEQLNKADKDLQLTASECLAIEDTFAGIEAAKQAEIPVIGVAHTYPNHMLQRRADWVVDYLREIKFDWIGERFGGVPGSLSAEDPASKNPTSKDPASKDPADPAPEDPSAEGLTQTAREQDAEHMKTASGETANEAAADDE